MIINKKYKNKNRKRKLAKKTSDDASSVFLASGIDVGRRIIDLFDDIDNETVGMAIKGVQLMMMKSETTPITIFINSFGGCPYSSFALYDVLRSLPCMVKTINVGCCMSGGSLIFLAGDERYCYENAVFMFHSVSSYAEGKVRLDLKSETEECERIHKQMCEVLGENTKKSIKQWNKLIEHKDVYYRWKQAKRLGIVNDVIAKKEDMVGCSDE